ncbi:DUF262 domain-containing protein [Nocardioides sp. InS609-2]|uniref:DUF262 domain-containing protein n=1 Tax=Nocardioides sp. InS609-2 TaxID=2760705 RepID=UPI0020BE6030|nr:DUF262 domain-containing protein [Nocardioides sp. InS609-2]
MADATKFNHDQIGHILIDHLLEVPEFQRKYSWDRRNVNEYLADLAKARQGDGSYFIGTVVFVAAPEGDGRGLIVDGQQRLATTAILLIAIRDLLRGYGKDRQAENIHKRFLFGYVITADEEVERLKLSPKDQDAYDALIEARVSDIEADHPIRVAYETCLHHLEGVAPSEAKFKSLVEISTQLEHKVQVLTAVASSLSEAYVIFETLNDRGADLTTADLLKNFLFSSSKTHISYVRTVWVELEHAFEKPDDLVKFLRYEFISRNGPTLTRNLYRAIQSDIGGSSNSAKAYARGLRDAHKVFLAIRDPENPFWNDVNVPVADALLAYRRLGFESSMPVLLAAFNSLAKTNAAKMLVKVINWSVRAQYAGRLGAQLAETTFGEAAQKLSAGEISTQPQLRTALADLIPTDAEFRKAFTEYGTVSNARAKYVLAMLERAKQTADGTSPISHNWSSPAVTIEHVLAKANKDDDTALAINNVGNLALLQRKGNRELDAKPFEEKRDAYAASEFVLTQELATRESWGAQEINDRTEALGAIACAAWPAH